MEYDVWQMNELCPTANTALDSTTISHGVHFIHLSQQYVNTITCGSFWLVKNDRALPWSSELSVHDFSFFSDRETEWKLNDSVIFVEFRFQKSVVFGPFYQNHDYNLSWSQK